MNVGDAILVALLDAQSARAMMEQRIKELEEQVKNLTEQLEAKNG